MGQAQASCCVHPRAGVIWAAVNKSFSHTTEVNVAVMCGERVQPKKTGDTAHF